MRDADDVKRQNHAKRATRCMRILIALDIVAVIVGVATTRSGVYEDVLALTYLLGAITLLGVALALLGWVFCVIAGERRLPVYFLIHLIAYAVTFAAVNMGVFAGSM